MRRIELIVETVSDWWFASETGWAVKLQEMRELQVLACGRLYFMLNWLSVTVIVRLKELWLFVVTTYPINQSNKSRTHWLLSSYIANMWQYLCNWYLLATTDICCVNMDPCWELSSMVVKLQQGVTNHKDFVLFIVLCIFCTFFKSCLLIVFGCF
jgi:hypothetical protein